MEDLLLLGDSQHQVWVHQDYKVGFFKELKEWRTIAPAQNPWVSSYGHATVPAWLFVHCLVKAECPTVYIKAYGQKQPLHPDFINRDPAETEHPEAHLNSFDIGHTVRSPYIYLFAPKRGVSKEVTTYPMITPGSKDYGSVHMQVKHNNKDYGIKIYPRMVHVIKSYNSRLHGQRPMSIRAIRHRATSAANMIKRLAATPASEIGGYRIEVSLNAQTLSHAWKEAKELPFLNMNHWVYRDTEGFDPYELEIKFLGKKTLLDNANWVYQKAQSAALFTGRDNSKPSRQQHQAITDVLAALGWNPGRMTPTSYKSASAWWLPNPESDSTSDEQVTTPEQAATATVTPIETIATYLMANYTTKPAHQRLLQIVRGETRLGYVPCKLNRDDPKHRYQVSGWGPFRLRCAVATCHHPLRDADIMRWVAQLIDEGLLPRVAVGMAPVATAEVQRPVQQVQVAASPQQPAPPSSTAPEPASALPLRQDFQAVLNTLKNVNRTGLRRVPTTPATFHTTWIQGDGNCQFSAFAMAIAGRKGSAKDMRATAVAWMRQHAADFEGFVAPEDSTQPLYFNHYLQAMARNGEYGDHLTLTALCAAYDAHVLVLKYEDGKWSSNDVGQRQGAKYIFCLYLSGDHYENLLLDSQLC